jgi:hypothetical protein
VLAVIQSVLGPKNIHNPSEKRKKKKKKKEGKPVNIRKSGRKESKSLLGQIGNLSDLDSNRWIFLEKTQQL